MGLPIQVQIRWWGITLAVLFFFMWVMGNTLLPFLTGAAIAYFLDPLVERMDDRGWPRPLATSLIMLGGIIGFASFILLLSPMFQQQFESMASVLPQYLAGIKAFMVERFPSLADSDSTLSKAIASLQTRIQEGALALARNVLSSSLAVFDFLLLLVVAPVVAFYMLLDWDKMVATIDSWIPREHVATVRDLARQVDAVMGGFLRGQLSVCAILGAFYAVCLELAGLEFGIVIGVLGGLLSFIPFVGAALGGIMSIGFGIFQFSDDPWRLAIIAVIFGIGQVLEGYVLTPRLVGRSVGLHPVWLMFSLSAFGAIFGFVGLLIAVPAAASIGVLLRFGLNQYKSGRLYRGAETTDPSQEP